MKYLKPSTSLTMKMNKLIPLFFLVTSLFLNLLQAQEQWELRQDKDGIAIYSRSSDYSNFDEFRAVTEIDQPPHTLVAVLRDINRIPDWMHSVISSRLLERQGDSIQIYYTEAKTPFPLKNRDGIYLNRFHWEAPTQTLLIDIEILGDYLEKEEDMVRISLGKGLWQARKLPSGKSELIFQMQVDPGGSIPSWLANMFVIDTPYETLKKLKMLLEEAQYQEVRYDFIGE